MDYSKPIDKIRHTASHVLAQAVLQKFPNAKLAIGPAVDDGFYYDFDLGEETLSEEHLGGLEKAMKKIIAEDQKMVQFSKPVDEAIAELEAQGQIYKVELAKELKEKGETVLGYYCMEDKKGGDRFTDMCAGPHIESTRGIGAVKLLSIAGAYWRGSEKNKMLQRIYGTAYATQEELDEHMHRLEEAKKRDHRKLGKDLGLFAFSELVGKGLPLFTPHGATIRRELERFIVDEEIKRGYLHVYTPDIARLELYKKSGHYPHYKDSMYAPIVIDEEEFMLRPMTCPHHFELYLSSPHSYKELPMRIAELGKLYRYEQSGELSGLLRVRSFCLADAHIICAGEEQAVEEISGALDLIEYVASTFGLKLGENYSYRLSLGDRNDEVKYYKNDEAWNKGESALRVMLEKRGNPFIEAKGEAAFYGPKIDIQMRNVNGKEDTAFTVQYDFCMPERFDLTYVDDKGESARALVVHRSSIGAIERIMAFLIEHYAGAFPVWLAPVQVVVAPVSDAFAQAAHDLASVLRGNNVRVSVDDSSETVGKKVRNAEMDKIPYVLVIGQKEIDSNTVAVRRHGVKDMAVISTDEFISQITTEIKERTS